MTDGCTTLVLDGVVKNVHPRTTACAPVVERRLASSVGGLEEKEACCSVPCCCFGRCWLLFLLFDGVDVDVMIGDVCLALETGQNGVWFSRDGGPDMHASSREGTKGT